MRAKRKERESSCITESKMSMKLLIDTSGNRVLFAEAGKDCVDFLFFILSLPLSALIRLLGKKRMVGSLPNLYESIETLNESYIQPNVTKDTLLSPISPLPGYSDPLLSLEMAPQASTPKPLYTCNQRRSHAISCGGTFPRIGKISESVPGCRYVFTDDPCAKCPGCSHKMSFKMTYVAPPAGVVQQEAAGDGFVKDVVTYMVMDDLVVKPMSTISSITLLNQFKIKNVGALEEKVVNLGMNEAVELLKASLVSQNVLTDVFFSKGKKNKK